MGKQLFLHADQKDMGKLQTLGGMQGHQLHPVAGLFLLIALQNVHQ